MAHPTPPQLTMARSRPADATVENGVVCPINIAVGVRKGRVSAQALKQEYAKGPIVDALIVSHPQDNFRGKILQGGAQEGGERGGKKHTPSRRRLD